VAISFPSSPVAGTSIYQGGRQWTYDGTTWNLVLGGAYELYWTHTGTGGETTLSGASDNGTTLTYPLGGENVYLNGVLLVRGSDYTATTGSTIVLANPLAVSDILTVVSYPAVQMSSNNIAQATEPTTYTPGMVWVNTAGNTQGLQLVRWKKTPTGGTTVLSGLADDGTTTLAYTAGYEEVYVNGILIVKGVDYTATNGTSITLTQATVTGDTVEVFNTITMGVTNTYTQSQSDARYIQLSQFTAKGDILVGTGASTETALNVGADGSTLVANSSAGGGVSWAGPQFLAGKNKFINGDFGIWQRGTSFSATSSDVITSDRWWVSAGSGGTVAVTQQTFTPGTAPVAGYESAYYLQAAYSASGSGTIGLYQRLEDVRLFAGQTVTVSFWAKVTSGTFSGAYFDAVQNFGSGGSGAVVNSSTSSTLTFTTSWQRFTQVIPIASISGKTIGTGSYLYPRLNLGATGTTTFQYWGLQIEAGSVATPFTTATGTVQGELAACQRYYFRAGGDQSYQIFGTGQGTASTSVAVAFPLPVVMRVAPTSVDFANLRIRSNAAGVYNSISAAGFDGVTNSKTSPAIVFTTTGASTAYYYDIQANNSTSAYLGFSAEL